jgi:hypothetical protein
LAKRAGRIKGKRVGVTEGSGRKIFFDAAIFDQRICFAIHLPTVPRCQTLISDDYLHARLDQGVGQVWRWLSVSDQHMHLVQGNDMRKDRAT